MEVFATLATFWHRAQNIKIFKNQFAVWQCIKIKPNFEILISYWSTCQKWWLLKLALLYQNTVYVNLFYISRWTYTTLDPKGNITSSQIVGERTLKFVTKRNLKVDTIQKRHIKLFNMFSFFSNLFFALIKLSKNIYYSNPSDYFCLSFLMKKLLHNIWSLLCKTSRQS